MIHVWMRFIYLCLLFSLGKAIHKSHLLSQTTNNARVIWNVQFFQNDKVIIILKQLFYLSNLKDYFVGRKRIYSLYDILVFIEYCSNELYFHPYNLKTAIDIFIVSQHYAVLTISQNPHIISKVSLVFNTNNNYNFKITWYKFHVSFFVPL